MALFTRSATLPRRVFSSVLLFGVAAIIWLTVAAMIGVHVLDAGRFEHSLTSTLELEAAALATADLDDPKVASSLFERFSVLFQPEMVAIVDDSSLILAHTNSAVRDETLPPQAGNVDLVGRTSRTNTISSSGRRLREYRIAIHRGQRTFGTLVTAVRERTLWQTCQHLMKQFPVGVFGAISLITLGGVFTARQSRSFAAVERQLRSLGLASSDPATVALTPVDEKTTLITGWNKLISERQDGYRHDMGRRVRSALDTLRKRKIEAAINVLPDGVAVSDEHGNITFANHTFAAQLDGVSDHTELLGQSITKCLDLDTRNANEASLIAPHSATRPAVVEVTRGENDHVRHLRLSRHPLRNDTTTPGPGSQVWCVRDLTQQRLAESARTDFIDAATHELRTPLANIMAYAETLATIDDVDTERQKEFCNTINSEAARLARFIDDLLDISSMEAGVVSLNRSVTDMNRLLRDTAGKLTSAMQKRNLNFHLMLPAKLPELTIDKDKIATTIVNLLSNALKYTAPGGDLTLRARVTKEQLHIDVEDTGFGISQEDLPHVFERFFRSESEKTQDVTGTGLGLTLAHEIARLHAGSLTVESQLGEGSKFTLTLPLDF